MFKKSNYLFHRQFYVVCNTTTLDSLIRQIDEVLLALKSTNCSYKISKKISVSYRRFCWTALIGIFTYCLSENVWNEALKFQEHFAKYEGYI